MFNLWRPGKLISQLDDHTKRDAVQKKLIQMGKSAFPVLLKRLRNTKSSHIVSAAKIPSPVNPPQGPLPELDLFFAAWLRLEFVPVPAGEFLMGYYEILENDTPQHHVRITKPFEMGKYQVTQAQWEAVMGSNPSTFKCANRPIENVSWDDAQQFITKLNDAGDGYRYRLPTEAEWEYAARAGSGEYRSGKSRAWYGAARYGYTGAYEPGGTHSVGQKQPNVWGLYDMLGNVWEWVQDYYDNGYIRQQPHRRSQRAGIRARQG
jgi:formylglycine-generating enzyme required for sulfatase activity